MLIELEFAWVAKGDTLHARLIIEGLAGPQSRSSGETSRWSFQVYTANEARFGPLREIRKSHGLPSKWSVLFLIV